jgi:hypothetical protein
MLINPFTTVYYYLYPVDPVNPVKKLSVFVRVGLWPGRFRFFVISCFRDRFSFTVYHSPLTLARRSLQAKTAVYHYRLLAASLAIDFFDY